MLSRVLMIALLVIASGIPPLQTAPNRQGQPSATLDLAFLRNAGWEISDGQVTVLVDPLITAIAPAGGSPIPDEPAVQDHAAVDARIKRADYILITHGHRDHMIDAPYIATKTRAYVIGTETIANLARAYSVPEQQLLIVRGGEDYDFGPFSLKVIPSLHSATYGKRFYSEPIASTAPRGLKAPLRWPDFVHGGELAYLLRMAGHEVLIMGGGNYIEREMEGLRPDIALVGADAARKEIYDYARRLMRALGYPPVVFPTHTPGRWDKAEQQNIEEFIKEVNAASPKTRVVTPRAFSERIVFGPTSSGR